MTHIDHSHFNTTSHNTVFIYILGLEMYLRVVQVEERKPVR